MDYGLEDVLAEAMLFLPTIEMPSDFEARWHLRPSSNPFESLEPNDFAITLDIFFICSYSQSFIRAYVLDNFYVCILMYILFYIALWYANNVSNPNNKLW